MPLMQVVFTLVIIGVILWVLTLIPMDQKIRHVINVIVVIAVVLWLLSLFFPGFWMTGPRVGRPR